MGQHLEYGVGYKDILVPNAFSVGKIHTLTFMM